VLRVAERREPVVLDASVLVDLLTGTGRAAAIKTRLRRTLLHAPAHMDAEVLSAVGRMSRAGEVSAEVANGALERTTALPVTRHPVSDLVMGAWARRDALRPVDALYVELAARLNVPLLTVDQRLARAYPIAEALGAP
jgi:predicted nucleic acid-binding protein